MSTAAHEPRRVGARRAELSATSKVTPRRNASEVHETNGIRYDSDEVPVLIRLPNLSSVSTHEPHRTATTQQSKHRIDRPSKGHQRASQPASPKVSKKPLPQETGRNKLVIAGVVGGVLVLALLFLFNGGNTNQPVEQDGWGNEDTDLLVELPVTSSPDETETALAPPPALPEFEYRASEATPTQFTREESEQAQLEVPYFDAQPQLQVNPNTQGLPITGWPSDETIGASIGAESKPADLWPGEDLSLEQGGSQYPRTNSPSEDDYQSSMYPSDTDTYRMGKLDTDRLQSVQGDRSGILDGNIAIPDTKSF